MCVKYRDGPMLVIAVSIVHSRDDRELCGCFDNAYRTRRNELQSGGREKGKRAWHSTESAPVAVLLWSRRMRRHLSSFNVQLPHNAQSRSYSHILSGTTIHEQLLPRRRLTMLIMPLFAVLGAGTHPRRPPRETFPRSSLRSLSCSLCALLSMALRE